MPAKHPALKALAALGTELYLSPGDREKIRLALLEADRLTAEVADYDQLLWKQSKILTDTANVLNGPPPALTTWSHHDLADLATHLKSENQRLMTLALRCPACGVEYTPEDGPAPTGWLATDPPPCADSICAPDHTACGTG